MDSPTTYLIRLSGTISTKSPPVRSRFVDRLEHNLREALDSAGVDYQFREDWSRLFVESDDERAAEILPQVFGVQSIRPSSAFAYDDLDDIVERGHAIWGDRVDGRTFGVDTRRVGQRDAIPFTSPEVNDALGGALDEAGGRVDLDDPEIEVRLEVHADRVFFFDRDIPGPCGLPIGTEGRALALVSGGFDSAVAAWMMMRRGVALDFLFCNLGGRPHEASVREVMGELVERWGHGDEPTLRILDFRPLLAELQLEVSDSYWQVLLKRLMMRAGSKVARRHGYPALVTGEAVGQVSTQTTPNLAAIEASIDTPILRPLVAFNKDDILDRAREIDLYDVAEQTREFCALQGGKPVTDTSPDKLDARESRVASDSLDDVVADERTVEGAAIGDPPPDADVQVDDLPEEAVLLDLRDESAYEAWHPPDAIHVPFETAVDQYALLPREPTWVIYCEVGLRSAMIAEKMQQRGFDAYSFEGGVPALREHLDATPDAPGAPSNRELEEP